MVFNVLKISTICTEIITIGWRGREGETRYLNRYGPTKVINSSWPKTINIGPLDQDWNVQNKTAKIVPLQKECFVYHDMREYLFTVHCHITVSLIIIIDIYGKEISRIIYHLLLNNILYSSRMFV